VTDNGCNRVLGFHNALSLGPSPPADLVLGQPDFVSTASACSQNGFGNPRGIFVDPATVALLISDFDFNRITVYSRGAIATNVNAALVIGQPDFVTCGPRVTDSTTLNDVGGLWYDAGFNLYAAQLGDNRVTRLNCPTGLPISTASVTNSPSITVSATFGVTPSSTSSISVSISLSPSTSNTISQTVSTSPSETPSSSVTASTVYVCGDGVVDPGEVCDPGLGNFGGATCCNTRCRYKRKGRRCGPHVACYSVPRCSGRTVNPGVCLPARQKRAGVPCNLPSSPTGLGVCDTQGNCLPAP